MSAIQAPRSSPTMPRPRPIRRWRDDRGVTAVIVALVLTVILMFVALAIDGGQAYVSHRTSQNASDAAAYAGTGALDHLLFDPNCRPTITEQCPVRSGNSGIAGAAIGAGTGTGADASTMHCYLVDVSGTRLVNARSGTTPDLCAGGVAAAADPNDVARALGVEADASVARQTYFANVMSSNFDHTRAGTYAVAVIQSFVGGATSPFIVCGSDSNPTNYDLLSQAADGTYTLKAAALQQFYVLESNHTPVCGAGSQGFKGLAGGEPMVLNQLNGVGTGNGNQATVAAAARGDHRLHPRPDRGPEIQRLWRAHPDRHLCHGRREQHQGVPRGLDGLERVGSALRQPQALLGQRARGCDQQLHEPAAGGRQWRQHRGHEVLRAAAGFRRARRRRQRWRAGGHRDAPSHPPHRLELPVQSASSGGSRRLAIRSSPRARVSVVDEPNRPSSTRTRRK